jgi:hypothetical protein
VEQGRYESQWQGTAELPYGENGAAISYLATALVTSLSVPISESARKDRRRWLKDDYKALEYAVQLESRAYVAHPMGTFPAEHYDKLYFERGIPRLTARALEALPFAEAERQWLTDSYHAKQWGRPDHHWQDTPKLIGRMESEIVSAGLRQVVEGKALMRRWWAWRRQTDEFEGQGSLAVCQHALGAIIELTFPEGERPLLWTERIKPYLPAG